jgi:hypothetical protein
MKTITKLLSFLGLALTVLPAFFVFLNQISWQTHANLMLAGAILWFLSAPVWMRRRV